MCLCLQHPDMPQEVLQMHLQRIIMMQIRQKQEEQRRVCYLGWLSHLWWTVMGGFRRKFFFFPLGRSSWQKNLDCSQIVVRVGTIVWIKKHLFLKQLALGPSQTLRPDSGMPSLSRWENLSLLQLLTRNTRLSYFKPVIAPPSILSSFSLRFLLFIIWRHHHHHLSRLKRGYLWYLRICSRENLNFCINSTPLLEWFYDWKNESKSEDGIKAFSGLVRWIIFRRYSSQQQ